MFKSVKYGPTLIQPWVNVSRLLGPAVILFLCHHFVPTPPFVFTDYICEVWVVTRASMFVAMLGHRLRRWPNIDPNLNVSSLLGPAAIWFLLCIFVFTPHFCFLRRHFVFTPPFFYLCCHFCIYAAIFVFTPPFLYLRRHSVFRTPFFYFFSDSMCEVWAVTRARSINLELKCFTSTNGLTFDLKQVWGADYAHTVLNIARQIQKLGLTYEENAILSAYLIFSSGQRSFRCHLTKVT